MVVKCSALESSHLISSMPSKRFIGDSGANRSRSKSEQDVERSDSMYDAHDPSLAHSAA